MTRRSARIAGEPAPIHPDTSVTTTTAIPRQPTTDPEMKKLNTQLKSCKTQLKTCKSKLKTCETQLKTCKSKLKTCETKLTTSENEKRILQFQLRARDTILARDTVHEIIANNERRKELENAKEQLIQYRAMYKEVTEGRDDQRANNGGAIPTCGICANPYSRVEERTPRNLGCGHTICLSCANNLYEHDEIVCPFDRITMTLTRTPADELVKNFSILDMCA